MNASPETDSRPQTPETIPSQRAMTFWNMFGSGINALSSFVLLTFVTRINGADDGGIFTYVFSSAQFLSTLACFETRAIQATDVNEDFSFRSYFIFRLITVALMMIASVVFILINAMDLPEAIFTLGICLYKALDGVSDSFQGLFQQQGRIDFSGKALGWRVLLSTIGFIIVLFATRSLIFSALSMVAISIIFIIFYDQRLSRRFRELAFTLTPSELTGIFKAALPLFFSSFMFSFVITNPRFGIEAFGSNVEQAYFGFLIMPAFVINLFTLFVFRPIMTPMAQTWSAGDRPKFTSMLARSLGWVGILTVVGVLAAFCIGIPILNVLSGLHLDEYRWDLCIIMLGGGCNGLLTVLYYALTIVRKQWFVLIGYGSGFVASLILVPILVQSFGITGATFAYLLPQVVMAIVMGVLFLWVFSRSQLDKS